MSESYYVDHAVGLIANLSSTSRRSMTVMSELDEMVQKLSAKLDEILASENILDSKEEIYFLRKVIENLTDRKSQLAVKNYDLIDQSIKVIDQELVVIQKAMSANENFQPVSPIIPVVATTEKPRVGRKRKVSVETEPSLIDSYSSIDPNEPIYCTCRRIAFGEMIACDNEECQIEWFHYSCVNLTKKPRNSWMCFSCSSKLK